jgi:hypothetical protein
MGAREEIAPCSFKNIFSMIFPPYRKGGCSGGNRAFSLKKLKRNYENHERRLRCPRDRFFFRVVFRFGVMSKLTLRMGVRTRLALALRPDVLGDV